MEDFLISEKIKIPNNLNFFISIFTFTSLLSFIYLSQSGIFYFYISLFLFSHLFLTNYALLHEATHKNLHSNPKFNYLLGVITGIFFPTSITMATLTHTKHHCNNRTDHEVFDYYYPTDNLFFKFGQWYSVLLGGFWPVAILGNILIFIYPNLPNTKLIQNIKSGNKMLEDMTKKDVIKIRVEVLIIILFWSSLIYFLQIDIFNFFLLFAAGGFNWSTRQYITHAFSKRSVWDGAINLKTNIIQEKLLLNGNWDLEHHLFPYLPWTYLKKSGKIKGTERNYLSQYFSMWGGPIPNHQSAPSPISREEYFKNRMSDSITTDNI